MLSWNHTDHNMQPNKPNKDHYQTLGVSRQAGEKQIRQAFRRLARQHHPDVNPGNAEAERRFKEINAAYEVLLDPEKRRKYDQYGDQWPYADQFEAARRGGGFPWGASGRRSPFDLHDLGGMGGIPDLDNLLGGLFRGRPGPERERQPRRGRDTEVPALISLEEAYTGTIRTVQTREGQGLLQTPRRLETTIPAGVRDGARVRMAGGGQPGARGGSQGDLYLVVSIQPHPRFERKGNDLHVEVPVPLADAILGGEAVVLTLKGTSLALRIPPESQNGQSFRLAGQGMPKAGASAYGDLYARLKVTLPSELSPRERELFQELKALRNQGDAV